MTDIESLDHPVGVPDLPVDPRLGSGDSLGLFRQARALAELLRRTETPIAVGLQGAPGSGKTSLINLVCEEIAGEFPVIAIDAWKYSLMEPGEGLAAAVFLGVLHQLEEKLGGEVEKSFFERVALLFTGAFRSRQLEGVSDDLRHRVGQLEELRGEMAGLVGAIVLTPGVNGRVVVFVDDLDRIQPLQALEVLELLAVFLASHRGVVLVAACGEETIRRGVEEKYGNAGGQACYDRLIQVPLRLPRLGPDSPEVQAYWKELLLRLKLDGRGPAPADAGGHPRDLKRRANLLSLETLVPP